MGLQRRRSSWVVAVQREGSEKHKGKCELQSEGTSKKHRQYEVFVLLQQDLSTCVGSRVEFDSKFGQPCVFQGPDYSIWEGGG